ncbi:MAG: DUF452 family protein [Muribaculum sp.]|uniref:DUF452 family protein n=1 Tax=Candidatus Merdivivens faecigallinarum TaxID=2840871 RepID=A0A9D9J0N7_9BACT|nr:DUF452 family protein [Candidatus Merdivivens faecigallinarum]
MIQHFITRKGRGTLSLFFAGWGMDFHPFSDYASGDADLMICYDYTDLGFGYGILEEYGKIKITAWSMGVWAAEQVLKGHENISEAIAINGTPLPADDLYGIPENIFLGTLENLSEASGKAADTVDRFRRRMCGDAGTFRTFMEKAPERDTGSLRDELASIWTKCRNEKERKDNEKPGGSRIWTGAVVCSKDRIFPAANQQRFWDEAATAYTLADGTHYCEDIMRTEISACR